MTNRSKSARRALVPLLLCLSTVATTLWAASFTRPVSFDFVSPRGQILAIGVDRGSVVIDNSPQMACDRARFALLDGALQRNLRRADIALMLVGYYRGAATQAWRRSSGLELDELYPKFQDARADLARRRSLIQLYRPPRASMKAALIPWRHALSWPLPALALLLAAPAVSRLSPASRRRLRGLCERCGYDLTANASGVCPECGTPTAQGAAA